MARGDILVRVLLLAVVAVLLAAFLRESDHAAPSLHQPLPSFDLPGDRGDRVRLEDFRGKIVVVNFWATWCPPCVEEIPSLNRFQQAFRSQGVEVLAISVDTDEQAYRRFLEEHKLNLRTARDPDKRISSVYGTFKYPESYIADREGRLVRKIVGPADWMDQRMVGVFQELLGK